MIKIKVDGRNIRKVVNKLTRMETVASVQVLKAISKVAFAAEKEAKLRATDISATGGLSRAITHEISPNLAIVRVRHPAAIFTEYGTSSRGENHGSPYQIKPINVRVLSNMRHIRANYAPFIAAKVDAHPGQISRPYMRPGRIKGELKLRSLLPKIASRIVKA